MTKDDVIRMAREAGFSSAVGKHIALEDDLERFFHMAQAHALANIDPSKLMSYQEGYEAGRTAEREACAKVCEEYNKRQCYNDDDMSVANECAAAIRARGEK